MRFIVRWAVRGCWPPSYDRPRIGASAVTRRIGRRVIGALLCMVLLCACAKKQPVQAVPEPKPLSCVTQDGAISFVFGADWTQDAQSYAYDLLCYAKTRELAAGVFSYTRAGAAQAFDPAQALDFHVKDFAGKRENARILEEHTVREDDGHRYTTVLLAAESDGEKLAYYFTLIEFAGYSDAFAVLVQAAPAEYFSECREEFDEIAASSALVEQLEMPKSGFSV